MTYADSFIRKKLLFSLLSCGLLVCLLVGCGNQNNPATAHHPAQDTCSTATAQHIPPRIHYAITWDADPQLADNNQGTSTIHVTAFDASNGHLLWQKMPTKVSSLYQSSLQQMVDGVIYIAASNQQNSLVLAIDAHDGHLLWQLADKQAGVSSMHVCAGKVYLRVGNDTLKAVRASDGHVLWTYKSSYPLIAQTFVVTARAAYLTAPEISKDRPDITHYAVIALNVGDGHVLWTKEYQKNSDMNATINVVAAGEQVYVVRQTPQGTAGAAATVQALQIENGKELWTTKLPANVDLFSAVATEDRVYLYTAQSIESGNRQDNGTWLIALDARSGKQLWQRQHTYEQISMVTDQGIYGYSGYQNGDMGKKTFCSLDLATGKDRWCVTTLQPSLFSLSESTDAVIGVETLQNNPQTLSQNLYALSKADGKVLWKMPWKSSSATAVTLTLVTIAEGQRLESVAL